MLLRPIPQLLLAGAMLPAVLLSSHPVPAQDVSPAGYTVARSTTPRVALAVPGQVWSDRRPGVTVSVTSGRRLPAGRLVVKEGRRVIGSTAVRARRSPRATVSVSRLGTGKHVLVGQFRSRRGTVLARSQVLTVVSRAACLRTGSCAPVTVPKPHTPAPTPTPTQPPTSTPSQPPTSTPSQPPSQGADPACRTARVWSKLETCGWPGPATTGVPAGQVYSRTVSGGLTITRDGTVVDGWRVSGGIDVKASNVVIRNSYVTNDAGGVSGTGVVTIYPGASATVTDSTLDGSNSTHACVWHAGQSMVVKRIDCQRVNDGIFTWPIATGGDGSGDNFTIEDSWLHSFTTQAANGHIDGFQSVGTKHGVFRHNTVDVSQNQNSAFSIYDERKNTSDVLVQDNLMTGGGFAIYAYHAGGPYSLTNVRFVDNVFSNAHYGCVGYWGVWFTRGVANDGWHRSGNTVLETGADLDATNPSVGGQLCR